MFVQNVCKLLTRLIICSKLLNQPHDDRPSKRSFGRFFFSHPCLRSSPFLILAFPLFHDLVHISEIDSVDVLLRSRGPSPVY